MVSKSAVLQKLAPFKNFKKVVSTDQTVTDIIDGIVNTHYQYADEYDKISNYFVGESELETARNIFNFLKSNVPYYIESNNNQTLRSPSAIVAMPGDCKSYALFANGVLDSLNRKGIIQVPLAFRFAGYKNNSREPQHVFAVMYPGTKKEIWIDPVLARFNEKRQPSFYKDKKIKMALIALSGVNYSGSDKRAEMEKYRDKLVNERDRLLQAGIITPGSSRELQYKVAINKVTVALQDLPSFAGIGEFDWQNAFSSLVSAAPDIISASRPGGGYTPQLQQPPFYQPMQPQQGRGINTNTILLIGGAALAAFLIFRKK
tara:strand:- start:2852 stop:3802 length:951 start_codon:yes stop_codon:yes gene_type:complete